MASRSINSLASKGVGVVIPDMCLGELVQVVAVKKLQVDFDDVVRELRKGRLEVGHVRAEDLMHYSNLVPRVRRADRLLESSDVRILALSMVDRDCQGLLTFERKLIDSTGLRKFIEKELNFKRGHLITDDPFRR